jgi:hypothetical protein
MQLIEWLNNEYERLRGTSPASQSNPEFYEEDGLYYALGPPTRSKEQVERDALFYRSARDAHFIAIQIIEQQMGAVERLKEKKRELKRVIGICESGRTAELLGKCHAALDATMGKSGAPLLTRVKDLLGDSQEGPVALKKSREENERLKRELRALWSKNQEQHELIGEMRNQLARRKKRKVS